MAIIKVSEITPKNIRGVVPEEYRGMPYRQLTKGEKVVIDSCVFSIYPAKNKNGEKIVIEHGEDAGKTLNNCTIYFGLEDGHYTSLKNDVVEGQMCALTGFDTFRNDCGYYPFKFDPETVEVIEVQTPIGKGANKKNIPVLAFQ